MIHNLSTYQRSSDPFHIVAYYIKWVTTSWTDGTLVTHINVCNNHFERNESITYHDETVQEVVTRFIY